MDLEIKLLSTLGKRERRALVRGFLNQIKPWLRHFEEVGMTYHENGMLRPVRLFQSQSMHSLRGAIGFKVRMARLKYGLSQAQLAKQVGIYRSHLSDIERGLFLPRASTRERLEKVLEIQLPNVGQEPDTAP